MKKWLAISAISIGGLFILYWQCTIPSDFRISNLENGKIHILGHGGNGFHSNQKINSTEAFQAAIHANADGCEMDVQFSKDSIPILFHDSKFETNANCKRAIYELNLAEIQSCSNDSISRLTSVLLLPWKTGNVLSLDLKNPSEDTHVQAMLCRRIKIIQERYPDQNILVESSSVELLAQMNRFDIKHLFYYCSNPITGIETIIQHKLDGISIRNNLVVESDIQKAHSFDKRVMIWGVNYPWEHRNAVLKSPDIIQTDNIRHLQSLLSE